MSSLTTPYGTTKFTATQAGVDRSIEAEDPLGGRERLWYRNGHVAGLAKTDPDATVPAGFASLNLGLDTGLSYYWDKRAMAVGAGDVSQASVTHWMWMAGTAQSLAVPRARKAALENRVWYSYPGQNKQYLGNDSHPSAIARVLDDPDGPGPQLGPTQKWSYEYNAVGKLIKATDPLGRETVSEYGTGSVADADAASGMGIDLLKVKQKNGTGYDLVSSTTYDARHRPLTVEDAAGQRTTYTYNGRGQLLSVTTAARAGITESRTTSYSYDANGYLLGVTGPAPGATTSFTYDGYGRVRTSTDSDGYTVTYDYDALDRVVKLSYPDGTTEETVYNRLDAERRKDRLGRWSQTFYDALRRPLATRDPLGRTTTQQWCSCGSLDKLVDANGNATAWQRDVQGRVSKEVRADGSFKSLVYEATTSRLKQMTDAKGQGMVYGYDLDDKLVSLAHQAAVVPTPDVMFSYRTGGSAGQPLTGTPEAYGRLVSMTDGTGTTLYSYHPAGVLGGTSLKEVDGPLANDTIGYGYDELGRVVTRTIDAAANSQTMEYDVLGRLSKQTNLLGASGFVYGYEGVTGRPSTVVYPNGQTTSFAYEANAGDHRLKQIHHQLSGGATLSRFSYTTDAVGNFTTWQTQTGADPAKVYEFGYDAADQLTRAVQRTTDPAPSILKQYGWGYDQAGNRTAEQIDAAGTASVYDAMNRLTGQQAGGAVSFKGTVNEPAAVTVQGTPALVAAVGAGPAQAFEGKATLAPGPNSVEVKAKDPTGNERTNTYSVSVTGPARSLTYDANGNLTGDGVKTYEWDAENRLTAVIQGTNRSEFTYDGLGRRVQIVEKLNGSITSTKRFLWCGLEICEERDAAGAVTKRFLSQGVQELIGGTASYFYTRDHLGSIREMTDTAGVVKARYDYDAWGRRTILGIPTKDADFGFTGHYTHSASGLTLAPFRAYDPGLGRWISEDPIGLGGGDTNLFAYVGNGPLNSVDPLGLFVLPPPGTFIFTGTVTVLAPEAVAAVLIAVAVTTALLVPEPQGPVPLSPPTGLPPAPQPTRASDPTDPGNTGSGQKPGTTTPSSPPRPQKDASGNFDCDDVDRYCGALCAIGARGMPIVRRTAGGPVRQTFQDCLNTCKARFAPCVRKPKKPCP